MKVAIITSGFLPLIDGVTVSGWQRVTKLSQWGHEVILFCPDYSSLEPDYPNWRDYTGNILPGVKVVNLPSGSFVGLDCEPNVTENIQSGNNGFLYTPGDRLDFDRKFETPIANKSLREAMGDRARNSIQQHSWEQAVRNLFEIWQEAIEVKSIEVRRQFATQAAINR